MFMPVTLNSLRGVPYDYLAHEVGTVASACLLLSGLAHRQKIVKTSAQRVLSIHIDGDVLDLQNSLLKVADHNVQALKGCEVVAIPVSCGCPLKA